MSLEYGQKVLITTRWQRTTTHPDDSNHERMYRDWEAVNLPTPVAGLFLGFRHLQSGFVHQEMLGRDAFGYEVNDQPYLATDKVTKVALVSPGPRRNPFYTRLEDLG